MIPFVQDTDFTLYLGDAVDVLRELPDSCVDAVVTSPPYLDARPEYPSPTLAEFGSIFRELERVTTCRALVNVGRLWRDHQEILWWADLVKVIAASGWLLADTKVWIKPNANPIHGEVFVDSHEYVFAFVKPGADFNVDAIRRPHSESTRARFGRAWTNHRGVKAPRESRARKTRAEPNPAGALPRSYVSICVGREKGIEHPAPMALELAEYLVSFGSWPDETVIDPFGGSGTTALAARNLGRRSLLIESQSVFTTECAKRLSQLSLLAEATP